MVYAFNLVSCHFEHATLSDEAPRVISSSAPLSSPRPEQVSLEPYHAVFCASLQLQHGLLCARVIDNGKRVQLCALALTNQPQVPAATFTFPDIVITCGLAQDAHSSATFLVVLTQSGKIFKLSFRPPSFWANPSLKNQVSEYQLPIGQDVRCMHVLDADSLLVSCKDGTILKLTQARASVNAENIFEDDWNQIALSVKSGWGFSWSAHRTTNPFESSPSCAISIASITNHRGIQDVAFTISRDRKLRIWSLEKSKCINHFDISFLLSTCIKASNQSINLPAEQNLYADGQQTLLRIVLSDDLTDPYSAYLVIYTAQPGSANTFLLLAISLNEAGEVHQLVSLGLKTIPSSLNAASLVDFQVAKVNPSLSTPSKNWVLWALWQLAGNQQLIFTDLSEFSQNGETEEDAWTPIMSELEDSYTTDAFEERIASTISLDSFQREDIARIFVKYIFEPGRYSPSTLMHSYQTYISTLEVIPEFDQLAALEDRIVATVGSSIQLATSTVTGAPLMDDFMVEIKSEWLRFLAIANESRVAAAFPLALAVDTSAAAVYTISRAVISTPIIQTEALTLSRRVAQSTGTIDNNFLSIPQRAFNDSYPHLAPIETRQTLFQLAAISSDLFASLPSEIAFQFEEELVLAVCKPLSLAAEDLVTDIYDRVLHESMAENRELLLEKIKNVPNLSQGLSTYFALLSSSSWAAVGSNGDNPGSPTILALALLTGTLQQGIKGSYIAALDLLTLIFAIYSEQEDLFAQASSQLNCALSVFHSIHLAKSLFFSVEVPQHLPNLNTSTDILTKRFGNLNMQVVSDSQENAWCLLNALLSHSYYLPLLSNGPSRSLLAAASHFLDSIGLQTAADCIETNKQLTIFCQQLLELGLPNEALQLAEKLPEDEALAYLKGRASLEVGHLDVASSYMNRAAAGLLSSTDNNLLLRVLPHPTTNLASFNYHAALLFAEREGTEACVVEFCHQFLQHAHRFQDISEDVVHQIWSLLLNSNLALSDFDAAFATVVEIPFSDLQSDCLRLLITALSEIGRIDLLLRYPFPLLLRNELEGQLEFRARNTDARSVPCFSKLLYSLHISRSDFKKGAIAMYMHARRLGECSVHNDFEYLIDERCQAYLAAINAIQLAAKDEAWIACPFPSRQKRINLHNKIPEEAYSDDVAKDLTIYELSDLRREYVCTLARAELASDFPELARTVTDLDPASAVALYSQANRYAKAFTTAHVCGVNMVSLFENLTRKCMELGKGNAEYQWIFEDEIVNGWSGSVESKAWRLLKEYVQEHDSTGRYRETVLSAILAQDSPILIPTWLSSYFAESNPSFYLGELYRSGYIEEALRFSLSLLQQRKASEVASITYWPLLDELLLVKSEADAPFNEALQNELKKQVTSTIKGIKASSKS